jgi:hypothetical protein
MCLFCKHLSTASSSSTSTARACSLGMLADRYCAESRLAHQDEEHFLSRTPRDHSVPPREGHNQISQRTGARLWYCKHPGTRRREAGEQIPMLSNLLQLHVRAHGGTLVDNPLLSTTQLVGGPPAPCLIQEVRDGVLAAQLVAVDSRLSPLFPGLLPFWARSSTASPMFSRSPCAAARRAPQPPLPPDAVCRAAAAPLRSDCGLPPCCTAPGRPAVGVAPGAGTDSCCSATASLDLSPPSPCPREAWADGVSWIGSGARSPQEHADDPRSTLGDQGGDQEAPGP